MRLILSVSVLAFFFASGVLFDASYSSIFCLRSSWYLIGVVGPPGDTSDLDVVGVFGEDLRMIREAD